MANMSDIVLIGLLILVNGFFAAAEMSLVTARETRLKALAETGDQRALAALQIRNNPGDFLSTIQIGITLVGTTASAIGGVEVVRVLSPLIAQFPMLEPYADNIALVGVVLTLTYFTLVFGELVPKRLALQNAEKLAVALSRPMGVLARFTFLPMRILSLSTEWVLRLINIEQSEAPSISPEEIEMLVKQGVTEGVLQSSDEKLISGVFDYTARRLREVMTPRTAIIAFEANTPVAQVLEVAQSVGYSRYPVYRDTIDHILGYVHIKDLIWADKNTTLDQHYRTIHFIPGNTSLPKAFEILVKTGRHMAIVIDEFGGTHGLLTLEDLLEEIVGEIEDEHSPASVSFVQRADSEWVLPGQAPITEVGDLLQIQFQPEGRYKTIAGFMMYELGFIPSEGDQVKKFGYVFRVQKREKLRIVEISVTPDK